VQGDSFRAHWRCQVLAEEGLIETTATTKGALEQGMPGRLQICERQVVMTLKIPERRIKNKARVILIWKSNLTSLSPATTREQRQPRIKMSLTMMKVHASRQAREGSAVREANAPMTELEKIMEKAMTKSPCRSCCENVGASCRLAI